MEMLAELLCQDALERKDEKEKVNLLKKSHFLYERLDTLSSTYSFERKRKIQEIQAIIDECSKNTME